MIVAVDTVIQVIHLPTTQVLSVWYLSPVSKGSYSGLYLKVQVLVYTLKTSLLYGNSSVNHQGVECVVSLSCK